ncbi:Methyltransferase-related protein [Trema orientale]|uniref:Methyltransferase-related protein n=1 Tax=Trema orientale TaxID=63057 RepID=A0A2P5F499_TREOI|nr:Methyltransferase-related protein [Trema orientale]
MCPLRFILVFFSAVLAGYFAWKTVGSSPGADLDYDDSIKEKIFPKEEETGFKRMVQNSFWVFVDMASGRYLWRNMREMKNKNEKLKSGSKL